MSGIGAPQHSGIPIGEEARPPFAVLPDPKTLFAHRAERLRDLARSHELGAYLTLLAGIASAQHRVQDNLPEPELPPEDVRERARHFAMPPLDRARFAPDAAFRATLERLLDLLRAVPMPEMARTALDRLTWLEEAGRDAMMRDVLTESIPMAELAEHTFVAAALQVHFARMAAPLDATSLVPIADGACPVCGGPPVASLIVGWQNAHGTRFCACSLCATLWNYVRIKCVLCGSTDGISYREIAGGTGHVKAEACEKCRGYVKILHQHNEPALEPVADDVATLALDLLVRDTGFRRGAFNPYLLGY